MRSTPLPFCLPTIEAEEIAGVIESLQSGWITTGPKVKEFERKFSDYIGCRNAVAVNSCTAGLHLALAALNVGPGDEVIVPTMTFCSTANVVVHCGAKPVLVDVGEDMNVSADAIERAITARTKAVIAVHYGGQSCELTPIRELLAARRIAFIEDAAHSVGAEYRNEKIGRSSAVAVFSFYATKNLTTGEGGMVTTPDDELAERIRRLTLHGMNKDAWKRYTATGSWFYEVVEAGFKYNMTDPAAALGISQLAKLDRFIQQREAQANFYTREFSSIPEVEPPVVLPNRRHAWHLYVLRLKLDALRIDRAEFIDQLRARNIGTSVHFIPVHLHPFYQRTFGYGPGALPVAESQYERMLSLPLYPRLSQSDLDDVVQAVSEVVSEYRR